MPASFIAVSTSLSLSDAASPRYTRVHGQANTTTTEPQQQIPLFTAGKLYGLSTRIITNTMTDPATLTLRVNGADTALSVTYGSAETGIKSELLTTVEIASGDAVSFKFVPSVVGAGTKAWALTSSVMTFRPNDKRATVSLFSGERSTSTSSASTQYTAPCDGAVGSGTESDKDLQMLTPGTVRGLFAYMSANARNGDVTFRTRVNAGDGNCIVTFGAGETGRKDDSANTDAVAEGDQLTVSRVIAGTSGSVTMISTGMLLETTNGACQMSNQRAVWTIVSSTSFYGIAGQSLDSPGSANFRLAPHASFNITQFGTKVSRNTLATVTTVAATFIDAAAGAMTVSYPPGVTGIRIVKQPWDTLLAGISTLESRVVTNVSDGEFDLRWLSMLLEEIPNAEIALGEPVIGSSTF